jgi:hypothetical protein
MALKPANHFTLSAKGVSGVVDTQGVTGKPAVSIEYMGQSLEEVKVTSSTEGLAVTGLVKVVRDGYVIRIRLVLPEVNVDDESVPFAAFAVVTTSLTSIGGPALVRGPLQGYELLPVAGVAAAVES